MTLKIAYYFKDDGIYSDTFILLLCMEVKPTVQIEFYSIKIHNIEVALIKDPLY